MDNSYEKQDKHTAKKKVTVQVLNHRDSIRESLESLHNYTDQVEEFAYSGDILQTVRYVKRLRDEAKHLHDVVDHLLIMLEQIDSADTNGYFRT